MGRRDLESPPRGRGSPRRRSSPRRERSPTHHRSSRTTNTSTSATDKISARNRSSKLANSRSRSPEPHSPVREKVSSRNKSPQMSNRSPKRAQSRSPKRARSTSPQRRRSLSSPSLSPVRERPSNHTRSPSRANSRSPQNDPPSPRTKRLRRAQAEREAEKASESDHEKNHSRRGDKASHRERGSQKEVFHERRDRRSGRDGVDNKSSRSRRNRSPSPNEHRRRNRSISPPAADRRSRDEATNSRGSNHGNGEDDSVAKMKAAEEALESKEKQKPSFELSGKLAAETNRVKGVTLLFTEPPDAKKPNIRWRLYVFKGGEVLNEPLYVHRESCYLFGRERRVADIPTDHPSCSKQHAVLQYRQVEMENSDGTLSKTVRPYIMDLGSTNGTFINDDRIEPQRYYELMEKDTLKFGNSSREYVLLHENSAG